MTDAPLHHVEPTAWYCYSDVLQERGDPRHRTALRIADALRAWGEAGEPVRLCAMAEIWQGLGAGWARRPLRPADAWHGPRRVLRPNQPCRRGRFDWAHPLYRQPPDHRNPWLRTVDPERACGTPADLPDPHGKWQREAWKFFRTVVSLAPIVAAARGRPCSR